MPANIWPSALSRNGVDALEQRVARQRVDPRRRAEVERVLALDQPQRLAAEQLAAAPRGPARPGGRGAAPSSRRRRASCTGASLAIRIWPGRHQREQRLQVARRPPGRVEEEVRVGRRLAPDPGQVGDAGVREDQPQAGVARADLDRVAAERGDAAAGVAEDRQPLLVGQREHVLERRVVEVEALRARVQLDAASAVGERAARLLERARRAGRAGRTGTAARSLAAASATTMSFACG